MILDTASAVVSFAEKMENDTAEYYESLTQRFKEDRSLISSFVKENKANIVKLNKACKGVITDTNKSDAVFSIEEGEYAIETLLPNDIEYSDALHKALAFERTIIKFYNDASEQAKGIKADIPKQFIKAARVRGNRIYEMETLVNSIEIGSVNDW